MRIRSGLEYVDAFEFARPDAVFKNSKVFSLRLDDVIQVSEETLASQQCGLRPRPPQQSNPSSPIRVLLIEDDTMLGKALVRGLKRNGLTVDWTRHGPDGHAALRRCEHAIALFDIGLPGMTGFEILKVAGASRVPPILVITARDWVEDMVWARFGRGRLHHHQAVRAPNLLARIRANIRRVSDRSNLLVSSKEITLDPSTYVATFRGIECTLSAREFSVLYALMKRPGAILSRSQIGNRI